MLVPRWDKCIDVTVDYVEVLFMPSATHVPRIHRSCNNVFGIRMFANLFYETPLWHGPIWNNKKVSCNFNLIYFASTELNHISSR
jgi:hypothetical protein